VNELRRAIPILAFAISAVSSPFVVTATTGAIIVWKLQPTWQQLGLWGGIVVVFSAAIPGLVVYTLWRTGRITDVHVAVREQRTIPFLSAIISGAVGVAMLHLVYAPRELVALGAGFLGNGAAMALISLRWKISVHVAVFTASVIALGLVVDRPLLALLVLLPAVLWARLYRGKHTLTQALVPIVLTAALTPAVYLGAMRLMD
jgi:hypothetical protein